MFTTEVRIYLITNSKSHFIFYREKVENGVLCYTLSKEN